MKQLSAENITTLIKILYTEIDREFHNFGIILIDEFIKLCLKNEFERFRIYEDKISILMYKGTFIFITDLVKFCNENGIEFIISPIETIYGSDIITFEFHSK